MLLIFLAYRWIGDHPEHNPFAPLTLAQPSGWAMQGKLARFADDRAACFSALGQGAVRYRRLPIIGTGVCGASDRTQILRWAAAPAPLTPSGVAPSCAVSAALLLWQRDVVQPMARLHLGRPVTSIEHLGSYNCRAIRGGSSPSEHASGNAIDISAFILSNGARVSLKEHWAVHDERSGFLHAVRDQSCGYFATMLSPDYNAAHANHFHFDQARRASSWKVCR